MKHLALLYVALLVAACDADKVPDRPATPPAKPTIAPSAEPVTKPVVTPAAPRVSSAPAESAGKPEPSAALDVTLDPLPEGDPEALPSRRTAQGSSAGKRPAPVPEPVKKGKAVAVEKVDLPEAELDLSLPDDWTEELEPEREAASSDLLPPLFGAEGRSGGVQLSGRLLPGDAEDEALIDGAELNFEFKR